MHIPVMVDIVIKYFSENKGKVFVDATLGCGGYAKKILENCKESFVIGIDCDINAINYTKEYLKDYIDKKRLVLINTSYINIKDVINNLGLESIDGVVFDLGMSTLQLRTNRGFSFSDEKLDMRMSQKDNSITAESIVNTFREDQLADIFYNYGEERYSRIVSKYICEYRKSKKIVSARELSELIKNKLGKFYYKSKIHPATKIFQALRIFVNNELSNIEQGVSNSIELLNSSGICVCVSFHSLEDRIVKNIFKKRDDCKILTKKPLIASQEEVKINPASRSAKLRVVKKI